MSNVKLPLRLLAFLTAVNILNYFDRYIVHSVEPILNREMQLTNEQSGYLVSAFVFGYFIFSPIFGYLGDRWDRRVLMAIGLFGWSVATALTGLASGFVSFFLARVLVGIGEASFGTIVPGYLKGRLSDPLLLNSALSIFYVAIPVGSALGYVAGGSIASNWSWQSLFFFASVPGLLLALGFLAIPAEDSIAAEERDGKGSFFAGLREISRVKVLVLAIVGYIFNTFALNGVAAFVVRYGSKLGMPEESVSTYFGIILVITGFAGTLGGGRIATRLASKSVNPIGSMLHFVSISTLLGVPFLAVAFLVESSSVFLACCFCAELLLFAGVAPLNSVIVGRSPKGLETLTQGVTIFSIQLFGSIMAPVAIGRVADLSIALLNLDKQSSLPLAYGMQLSSLAAFVSAAIWYAGSKLERISEVHAAKER